MESTFCYSSLHLKLIHFVKYASDVYQEPICYPEMLRDCGYKYALQFDRALWRASVIQLTIKLRTDSAKDAGLKLGCVFRMVTC